MGSFWTYSFESCFFSGGEHHWLAGVFSVKWVLIYNISAFHPNKYRIYLRYLVHLNGTEHSLTL